MIEKEDPRGRKYYWIGGTGYEHVKEPGTDVTCVHDDRQVSITPMVLDFTDHGLLSALRGWSLEGYSSR